MSTDPKSIESLVNRRYEHGFVTDIESDSLPPGLDENVIRAISARKKSPSSCSSGVSKPIVTG